MHEAQFVQVVGNYKTDDQAHWCTQQEVYKRIPEDFPEHRIGPQFCVILYSRPGPVAKEVPVLKADKNSVRRRVEPDHNIKQNWYSQKSVSPRDLLLAYGKIFVPVHAQLSDNEVRGSGMFLINALLSGE